MTFQDFIDRCFDTWSGFLLLDKILFIACIAMIVLSLVWEVADCYIVAQRKRAKAKRKRKYGSERARNGDSNPDRASARRPWGGKVAAFGPRGRA